MKTQLSIGRVSKVNISIHWTFLLLLLWILLINLITVFQIEGMVWSILLLFCLIGSLFAHELGHAIMARFFKARISSIVLLPSGALNHYLAHPKKRGQEMLILIAGPLVNLLLAALLSFFNDPFQAYWNLPESIGNATRSNFLFQLQLLNLSLFLLNLIPAFPMDGGGILKALLSYRMSEPKANRVVKIISRIIGYTLIIGGIIWVYLLPVFLGVYILLTCGIATHKANIQIHGSKLAFMH